MSLTKAIEAAKTLVEDARNLGKVIHGWHELSRAIAALPDKPMTDDELTGLCHEIWALAQLPPNDGIEDGVKRIKHALKSANVLYVEE